MTLTLAPTDRLAAIQLARQAVLTNGHAAPLATVPDWVERSWRRCLASGQHPHAPVPFDAVPRQAPARLHEAHQHLLHAAQPVLIHLGSALAATGYFAVLTNAQGVVIDSNGPIDSGDRRARLITRVGVDLSEAQLGTTAIGAALAELRPVWLHRGEHFFTDNSAYSCAGAPLFGPDGTCVGMLDLTGIEATERPELQHLAAQSARGIENRLLVLRPHRLLLRLNWPGHALGHDGDGLVALDADGCVVGANRAARQMVPQIKIHAAAGADGVAPLHCGSLFAMGADALFDAARRNDGHATPTALEVPLWSGLRLQLLALHPGAARPAGARRSPTAAQPPLKEIEITLIRRAVDEARGNVMQAARALGISRATVYRKLGGNPKTGR